MRKIRNVLIYTFVALMFSCCLIASAENAYYDSEIDYEFILGDLNSDKIVNAVDLSCMKMYLLNLDVNIDEKAADVNKDRKTDIRDLVRLKKKLVSN